MVDAPDDVIVEKGRSRLLARKLGGGRRRLAIEPPFGDAPRFSCDTTYPDALIRHIVDIRGLAWACDEIARDEDPNYVERLLRVVILGHVESSTLAGGRVLDFGCGAGASTVILGRMLPQTEIVGVELHAEWLGLAAERARHHRLDNVSFLPSPEPLRLPEGIGRFTAVNLSAVWEHMLPAERTAMLPRLWGLLDSGGVLFVSETPHRWSPIELHTTRLPLLNYLPDALALRAARRFSDTVRDDESWPELLRRGIRGGARREILSILRESGDGRPAELPPLPHVGRLAADTWYAASKQSWTRRRVRDLLGLIEKVTGGRLAPNLLLAIRKDVDLQPE